MVRGMVSGGGVLQGRAGEVLHGEGCCTGRCTWGGGIREGGGAQGDLLPQCWYISLVIK